jgi:hypothetical protein
MDKEAKKTLSNCASIHAHFLHLPISQGRCHRKQHNHAMTLTELKYIVAVAREKHFGKGAEACHVSQPTLSVAIKKRRGIAGLF